MMYTHLIDYSGRSAGLFVCFFFFLARTPELEPSTWEPNMNLISLYYGLVDL